MATQNASAQTRPNIIVSDFEGFPYQAGSSLNAGGIGYGLLRQEEAIKRLKTVESLTAAGGSGR